MSAPGWNYCCLRSVIRSVAGTQRLPIFRLTWLALNFSQKLLHTDSQWRPFITGEPRHRKIKILYPRDLCLGLSWWWNVWWCRPPCTCCTSTVFSHYWAVVCCGNYKWEQNSTFSNPSLSAENISFNYTLDDTSSNVLDVGLWKVQAQ